jgi:hypothetical protein
VSIDETSLGTFGTLGKAIGLLDPTTGSPNPSWFGDPIGSGGNQHGLRELMSDDDQRAALISFVDDVLGPPDRVTRAGETWVPLFTESDPNLTISAVVAETAGTVRLGIGAEFTTKGGPPQVSIRVHVPVFQFARHGSTLPASGPLPTWLVLGRPGGRVEIGVDATFTSAPPAPGAASLGGAAASLAIPTSSGDELDISITLRDLQLPGAAAPATFTLDASSLSQLGEDVFHLLIGLVRAQADALDLTQPALRPFAAITGLLGIRDVPSLPPLPLADLPTRGLAALVGWVEGVLSSATARDAWLGQLALLVGGTVDGATDAVVVAVGPMRFAVGLRVTPGTGGHPVLVPTVSLAMDTRSGVRAQVAADLLRADTGSGACSALPDLRVEAVFGADAGGSALLAGPDPRVGSVHAGVHLDAAGHPAFLLTLGDVTVGGAHHDVLDLSSPAAAMNSAESVLESALANAISSLGAAGALINSLLGLTPPAGITPLSVPALFANPLAAVLQYWHDLTGTPAAAANVLGQLQALLIGGTASPVSGDGSVVHPWQASLIGGTPGAPGLNLRVWRDGDVLDVALAAAIGTTVLTDYTVTTSVGLTLLRLDLATSQATFATDLAGSLALARTDAQPARLAVGALILEAGSLAGSLRWTPQTGLRASLDAAGLALALSSDAAGSRIPFELPTWDATGHFTLPAADWTALERVLALLLRELDNPVVTAMVDLLGWNGSGSHLALAELIGGTAETAIKAWLADLVLNCERVRVALGPVAALLSGFALGAPYGEGTARSPYRCPVTAEPRAPGIAVWLDPGCPPLASDLDTFVTPLNSRRPLPSEAVVAAMANLGTALPDVADLLVGRDSLASGLDLLATRWVGTDGLVGQPVTLPNGVTGVALDGLDYNTLVALGSAGYLAGYALDSLPTAVLQVGCEATWATNRAAGTAFDRSAPVDPGSGVVPATGNGAWYVRLPTPAVAAAARPDRGAVGEQASRLADVLAGRTDPITVIAYGAAAAAAIRAAATATAVSTVVTVGAPWGAVAVDSLATGLGGDALRLLGRLMPASMPAFPDPLVATQATPTWQLLAVVDRCTGYLNDPAGLPSAAAEPVRSALAVRAVFGSLDADTVALGVAGVVAQGLRARFPDPTPGAVTTGLHLGAGLPVLDLNLGGLLVGVGATVELCGLARPTDGSGLTASLVRGVIVDVHLGVTDGWLVGGPGSANADGDLRFMSARIDVALDGRIGDAELVLHEATALGVTQERWVVRADANAVAGALTTVVPEVRVLVGAAVARLRAASPDLAGLLDLIGLTRNGGLDPDGLDRLMHDTVATMRAAFTASPADLAAHLRALIPAATGSATTIGWAVGPATVGLDLATGGVTAGLRLTPADTGCVEIDVAVTATALGGSAPTVGATLAIGALDPDAGGVRVVGTTSPAALAVEWAAPRAAMRRVTLLPSPDTAGLTDLAIVVLPAVAAQTILSAARWLVPTSAAPALEVALDAVGLLGPADPAGVRAVRVPVGLIQDPGAWLTYGTAAWRTNLATSAVALLDALAPIVVPARGAHPGWPLTPGLAVTYAVEQGNALRLGVAVQLSTVVGSATVTTDLTGGLVIGGDGRPAPALSVAVEVDGRGLRLAVDTSGPVPVRLSLVRVPPAPELQLYPSGPGLGQALAAIGETVLPPVLDAIAAHRTDPPALLTDVGQAIFDLGTALDLVDTGHFSGARITAFAGDPAGALVSRLPQVIGGAAASLAGALDPTHAVVAVQSTSNQVTLSFGHGGPVQLVLDATGAQPAIELHVDATVPGFGHLALERLRLSAAGIDISLLVGPVGLDLGAFTLRPVLVVRAGSASASRMIGIGLALDDTAARSVEVRWALNAQPPSLAAITRTGGQESTGSAAQAAQWLLALGTSLAGGVLVGQLHSLLNAKAIASLQGVVFTDTTGSTQLDPGLALDLFDPQALQVRLQRLLWNAAATPALSITLDATVTIALAALDLGAGRTALGLNLTLVPGKRYAIAQGDTTVELEVDASWVNPTVPAGLSVYVLAGTSAATLQIAPAVTVAGLGLRFTNPSGPLLSLGPVSLDGVAVQVYAEASQAGVGGGVDLQLTGLSFAPSGGAGDNGVANGIMADAGKQSSPAARPSFSPALAIQRHPGHGLDVGLRAGDPPGPWWLVIQRQLGPLYLERLGFDSASTNGTLSRVTLLFDGRVSLFGLTASVDQLSLSWLGGDALDIHSWAVDLMGLAVSANMSGVTLAGGILKTPGPPISYVGMLLGKFGVYGLTVFGGYTDDAGSPSFFVFGAVNGPIGGPPAFFLTGLGGGLGINRGLVIPDDPSKFNQFPFIQALDPAAQPPADPMAELRALNQYFPPESGNFWFAAGISFTCFSLVDGIAVVSVSFGQGLEIDLLGLARLALPRPQAALVSIELGLLARFSTTDGLFEIRAALTSNSWLLYPDVHLTGGFAFETWWKGPLSGQFVMTLGGYHPDFHVDGYPVVPRLGLNWRITDNIVIKGGSYFALTSEAVMAGVDVEASADFGWIWAKVAFGANGLVYFDPFWFEVDAYARISAGVKIDTFLGTISLSISLGASIKVWGPEFSGHAELEIGPCSLGVSFGSGNRVEAVTLTWAQFVTKYLEDAGGGTARALSSIAGKGSLPAATGGDRSAPTPDGSADHPFEVYAEFELTVVTTIPTARFDAGRTDGPLLVTVTRSDGSAAQLGLKPMRSGGLDSRLEFTLEKSDGSGFNPIPAQLTELADNLVVTPGSYPIGVWGQPDSTGTTAPALPTGDVLVAGSQAKFVAQATQLNPGPEIDYYRVEASRRPLPLQATGTDRAGMLSNAASVPLPTPTTAAAALDAASALLFPPSAGTASAGGVPAGVLPSAPRSALAKASYRGEMVAPPLFGTLADGMAPANGADATATRGPAPAGPPPAPNRSPVVAGFLTSGAGAVSRPVPTTVADREIPRHPAPTAASVSQFFADLPVRLVLRPTPAVPRNGTLVVSLPPRTVVPGAIRSYGQGSSGLTGLLALPSNQVPPRTLAAGEAVTLALPDAARDVVSTVDVTAAGGGPAPSAPRPVLAVDGSARVVALRGDGEVVADVVVSGDFPVPAGTAVVAVQADGVVAPGDGLAGWHAASRVCAVGSHAALAPGCVLTSSGTPAIRGVTWSTAASLLAGAATVVTRFAVPVRSVALVLEAGEADRVDGVDLDVIGARRARGAGGAPLPPSVVHAGAHAVVIFPLDPAPPGAAVRVRAGGDWLVTGVLGGDIAAADLVDSVVRRGVAGVAGRLLSVAGTGCRLRFTDPVGANSPRTFAAPTTNLASTKGQLR